MCWIINRARLLELRSKGTLKILEDRTKYLSTILNSSQVNSSNNLLDTIIEYTDYNQSLPKLCMPDDFKWIDTAQIMQHIVKCSFNVTDIFSIDIVDLNSKCICKILNKECKHLNRNSEQNFNHCLTYWPSRTFMEFSINSLEEYYTKLYILHMNKLQFNHEFLPVDILVTPNSIAIPPISVENLAAFSDDSKQFNEFRCNPLYGTHSFALLQIYSEVDCTGISTATPEECTLYRNSLPTTHINSLSVDSSYEESQIWIKLAVQLAFHSQDIIAIIQTCSLLVRNYLYIGKDYVSGIEELDKLLQFLYNCLVITPRIPSNLYTRMYIQSMIAREKSVLIQYKKHVYANIPRPFYPAQLMIINISIFKSSHYILF